MFKGHVWLEITPFYKSLLFHLPWARVPGKLVERQSVLGPSSTKSECTLNKISM